MKRYWYKFWHFWYGCPLPLLRIDNHHATCPLCGMIATHGGDWGI